MGLLRKVGSAFGVGEGGPARIDPADGDAELLEVRRSLESGDWEPAAKRMAGMRDWDRRAHWARRLGELPGRSAALDEWAGRRADSADALLVRGMHRIHEAWQARGFEEADHVSAEAFATFHRILAEADEDLARAAELDREDPTPVAGRLNAARGLEAAGEEDVAALLAEARRRDRFNVAAHEHALWWHSAKWGGSEEAMFAVAREATARAPQGHRIHVLIAMAHLDTMPTEGDGDPEAALERFRQSARSEVLAAARSSVLAAGYPMTPATVVDRNWFAAALWALQAWDEANVVFESLGGMVTLFPFGWFHDDAVTAFRRARRQCTLNGKV